MPSLYHLPLVILYDIGLCLIVDNIWYHASIIKDKPQFKLSLETMPFWLLAFLTIK